MNARQTLVLNHVLDGMEGKLKNARWASVGKCSADTALRDISDLVEQGCCVGWRGAEETRGMRCKANRTLLRFRWHTTDKDIRSAVQFLNTRASQMGPTGFYISVALALLAAAQLRKLYAAVEVMNRFMIVQYIDELFDW